MLAIVAACACDLDLGVFGDQEPERPRGNEGAVDDVFGHYPGGGKEADEAPPVRPTPLIAKTAKGYRVQFIWQDVSDYPKRFWWRPAADGNWIEVRDWIELRDYYWFETSGHDPTSVEIKWLDAHADLHGPMSIPIGQAPQLDSRRALWTTLSEHAVGFAKVAGSRSALFGAFVADRCLFEHVEFRIDAGDWQQVTLPACGDNAQVAPSHDQTVALPPAAATLEVRVTFKDATRSEVARWEIARHF
ncbi:MAG: hypothetical protein AAF721_03575 [Myxococcota bacterium]